MRILVHEFASGGGFAGSPVPESLAREGSAMLKGLLADLVEPGRHDIVATADARFPIEALPKLEVVTLPLGSGERSRLLESLIRSVDAAWFIAPETGGRLEHLAAMAERQGTPLAGSGSTTIRRVSDKARLGRRLASGGVAYPTTRVLTHGVGLRDWQRVGQEVGYPLIAKPSRGAGCEGVFLARDAGQLGRVFGTLRDTGGDGSFLLQPYLSGVPVSVSLLADGRRAVALTVNAQELACSSESLEYRGGMTPLEHPLSGRAIETALETCQVLGGLRGYVGVDLVLTDSEPVVIEVNPRLTTAYLGVRASLGLNVAELALRACKGQLPSTIPVGQSVRFTASGEVVIVRTASGSALAKATGRIQ